MYTFKLYYSTLIFANLAKLLLFLSAIRQNLDLNDESVILHIFQDVCGNVSGSYLQACDFSGFLLEFRFS